MDITFILFLSSLGLILVYLFLNPKILDGFFMYLSYGGVLFTSIYNVVIISVVIFALFILLRKIFR